MRNGSVSKTRGIVREVVWWRGSRAFDPLCLGLEGVRRLAIISGGGGLLEERFAAALRGVGS